MPRVRQGQQHAAERRRGGHAKSERRGQQQAAERRRDGHAKPLSRDHACWTTMRVRRGQHKQPSAGEAAVSGVRGEANGKQPSAGKAAVPR